METIATISDIARDAGVSVETVLRVLNRDEVSRDISTRVAAALESRGFQVPGHLQTSSPERSQDAHAGAALAPQRPPPESGRDPSRTLTGEILETTRPLPGENIDRGIGGTRDYLLQAMLQAAEADAARSGLPTSLRYQSLEIGPLAERMTVVDQLLGRLVEDFETVRDELRRGRTEGAEDLALLVDLITTSWRTIDQRLTRMERRLAQSAESNGDDATSLDEEPADEQRD